MAGVPSDRLTLAAIRAEEEGYVRDTIERVRQAQADRGGPSRTEADEATDGAPQGPERLGPLADRRAASSGWSSSCRVWSAVGKDYRFDGTAGLRPRASVRPAAGLRPDP
ncbi:MAG: hypothetical protein M0C28_39365 [Candidatus Moduliflexus flocculans]|nr:hypothetical protein [Candidatus Moduliflexus flocculans]